MCLFTKGAHATLFCLDVSHSANTLQEIYMTNLDMFSHMKAGLVLIYHKCNIYIDKTHCTNQVTSCYYCGNKLKTEVFDCTFLL